MSLNYTNIVKIALLYLVIWCISPPLSYGVIFRLLAIVVVFVCLMFRQTQGSIYVSRYQLSIIVLLGYMYAVSVLAGDSINYRIGTYIFLFVILVSESLWNEEFEIRRFYFIIPLAFLLFTIWNVRTLQGIAEVPNIMRLLAKNSSISMSYAQSGVGGYGYMYTVLIFLPVGLDCIVSRCRNTIYRLLAIPYVVTTYMLSFQSQYFLALLITAFITVLFIGFRVKNTILKLIIIILILGGFITLYINVGDVLLYLRNTIEIRSIQLKLDSMYELIVNEGSVVESEFYVRYDRYTDSLLYALKHPIMGGFSYKITGNHSHLLDYLAQYGIPVGIFYIITILRPVMRLELRANTCSFVVCTTFLIILIMNTLAYSFAAVLYILVPVYYRYSKERTHHG